MGKVPKYKPPDQKSAADVLGPWVDPGFESGLIQRCRQYWTTPIAQLPNEMLATFLRQGTAVALVAPEARGRIEAAFVDGTELYDGELAEALARISPDRRSAD